MATEISGFAGKAYQPLVERVRSVLDQHPGYRGTLFLFGFRLTDAALAAEDDPEVRL